MESSEDKMIRLYEKKLGVKKKNRLFKKQLKTDGFDDDLFDFLDGISSKIKQPK